MGNTWNYLDITALGRQEAWEDSPEGVPANPAVLVAELPRRLQPGQVITRSRECQWRSVRAHRRGGLTLRNVAPLLVALLAVTQRTTTSPNRCCYVAAASGMLDMAI